MSILPLPIFERDADPQHRDALTDAEAYARLRPPTSIVVRYGRRLMVGEFPYDGDSKPGCGSKLVARTPRGVELAEMLTTTCSNSGCSKSVSRKEMLDYIGNSGGRDYPFSRDGRVIRVATVEDLARWSAIRAKYDTHTREVQGRVRELELPMRVIDVEPILGGETVSLHYSSEERIDFRELVHELAGLFKARIEMVQTGARDEARLTADYERCGQHCCCKTFLKVLRPVSMKSAKVQKATLDPLKISGRCGRLMCCLRYEDETYEALQKRLPRNKSRVGTPEGPGMVIDSKILVQLVLVRLEADGREVAVPVEELSEPPPPGAAPEPPATMSSTRPPARTSTTPTTSPAKEPDPLRGMPPEQVAKLAGDPAMREKKRRRRRKRGHRGGGVGPDDAGAGGNAARDDGTDTRGNGGGQGDARPEPPAPPSSSSPSPGQ